MTIALTSVAEPRGERTIGAAKAAKSLLYRARNELRESLSPFTEVLD